MPLYLDMLDLDLDLAEAVKDAGTGDEPASARCSLRTAPKDQSVRDRYRHAATSCHPIANVSYSCREVPELL